MAYSASKTHPTILSDFGGSPECPECCIVNTIWTNLTDEEVKIHLNSGVYTVPHSGYKRCSLMKSSDQLITPETWTSITFDIEIYNIGNIHNKIDIERINLSKGYWDISYQIDWQSKKDTDYQGRVMLNGISVIPGLTTCLFSSKDDFDFCIGIENTIKIDYDCYIMLEALSGAAIDRHIRNAKTFLTAVRRF